MKKNLLTLFALIAGIWAQAQPYGTPGQLTNVPISESFLGHGFVEYIPIGYDGIKTFPLVLSFAGTGEFGDGTSTGLSKVRNIGVPREISNGRVLPAVVISPQHSSYFTAQMVKNVIDKILTEYKIDEDRIYVTGLSAGGQATVAFVDAFPNIPAAVIPICSPARVSNTPAKVARKLIPMPWWAFHNFDDGTVNFAASADNFSRISGGLNPHYNNSLYPYGPGNTAASIDYTIQMLWTVNGLDTTTTMALDSLTKKPRQNHAFTLYKSGGHNSWTKTYAQNIVWEWLFAQSRSGTVTAFENSIEENLNVSVFPNPSQGSVEVKINKEVLDSVQAIELYNQYGVFVSEVPFSKNETVKLSFDSLNSGVYYLQIQTSGKPIVKKLVIE